VLEGGERLVVEGDDGPFYAELAQLLYHCRIKGMVLLQALGGF
jgi:hypothetical protein